MPVDTLLWSSKINCRHAIIIIVPLDSFQLPLKPPLNLLAHKKHLKLILSLYHFNTPNKHPSHLLAACQRYKYRAAWTLQNVPFGTYIQDPHWLSRNDVVFNRKHPNSYLQVIFRGTHWADPGLSFLRKKRRCTWWTNAERLKDWSWNFLLKGVGTLDKDWHTSGYV